MDEKEAARHLAGNPDTPLYSNSENALAWVEQHLSQSSSASHARLFKDKISFRELVRDEEPDFFFRSIALNDINTLDTSEIPLPVVIKPSVGFFSIGVHIIRKEGDWDTVREDLDMDSLARVYPKNVLDTSTFIIEEYIEGEEFAIDAYYNTRGEAVILNILHHRFSSGEDTSDRVYSTSMVLLKQYGEKFRDYLQALGQKAGIRNFPVHVEVRVNDSGQIRTIEVNPLRFGGHCTTADLMGIATGFNPYKAYQESSQPDWPDIYREKENKIFSIIVLNNSTGYDPEAIESFDYQLLEQEFSNPLLIRRMDVSDFGVFGFVFAETDPENEAELERILVSDLRKYIRLKQPLPGTDE